MDVVWLGWMRARYFRSVTGMTPSSWYITSLYSPWKQGSWGRSGADRTQVGPMLAPWTLLSGVCFFMLGFVSLFSLERRRICNQVEMHWSFHTELNSISSGMENSIAKQTIANALELLPSSTYRSICPPWSSFNINNIFLIIVFTLVMIRWSWDCLNFFMWIPILQRSFWVWVQLTREKTLLCQAI